MIATFDSASLIINKGQEKEVNWWSIKFLSSRKMWVNSSPAYRNLRHGGVDWPWRLSIDWMTALFLHFFEHVFCVLIGEVQFKCSLEVLSLHDAPFVATHGRWNCTALMVALFQPTAVFTEGPISHYYLCVKCTRLFGWTVTRRNRERLLSVRSWKISAGQAANCHLLAV